MSEDVSDWAPLNLFVLCNLSQWEILYCALFCGERTKKMTPEIAFFHRKYMMTSSNKNIFRCTGPLWGVPHKGKWRGTIIFFFIRTWTNGGANDRNVGDLRRHRAHYDVLEMITLQRPVKMIPCSVIANHNSITYLHCV